jgi:molybdate transport system substrate-binding protein
VSAASSLSTVLPEIARDVPTVRAGFNFGSSSTLVTQIRSGAPADVVATADAESMARLARAGRLLGEARVFATNRMVIVTEPGNPHEIRSVGDLREAGVVALCAESAPCGRYAATVLARSGTAIDESTVTRLPDAAATIGAVTRGDADAAIVYASDARTAGEAVRAVAIPAADNVVARYPIGVLRDAVDRGAARTFLAAVLGPDGRRALAAAGFGVP